MNRKSKIKNEVGASLAEYALLVALVAAVCIGALTRLGSNVNEVLTTAAINTSSPVGFPEMEGGGTLGSQTGQGRESDGDGNDINDPNP